MKIAFCGGGIFPQCFELVARSPHKVIKVFTKSYDNNEYNFAQSLTEYTTRHNIDVQYTRITAKNIEELKSQGCEAIISAGYSFRIPPWEGGSIKYAINIHASLLPQGAGPMPLPWVILKGLKTTGVTIHKVSSLWDGGDILLQESFGLTGAENLEELLLISRDSAASLLHQFLKTPNIFWDGAMPQPFHKREYWPRLTPQDYKIDWNWELCKIEKYLRIYRDTDVHGVTTFIKNIFSYEQAHIFKNGTIISVDGKLRRVAAQGGFVSFEVHTKDEKYDFLPVIPSNLAYH